MKEYIIRRKADWLQIREEEMPERPFSWDGDIRAFFQICYDDQNLYVRLRAHEADIRAENTYPLSEPCEDSCLELFFSPDQNSTRYFNVEFNPRKLLFLGIGTGIDDLMRLYPVDEARYGFEPEVVYLDDGWQITYHIPFAFIRVFFPDFSPKSGSCIRANCCCTGELCTVPHYLTWNPVDPAITPAFHNPACFGRMWFE